MKKIIFVVTVLLGLAAAPCHAAVQFSTSGTDAGAGNMLDLQVGQTGSMFLWMSTDAGQVVAGAGIDILSSDANILEATSYEIANPSNRWAGAPNNGTLGDLVTGSNAFAIPGFGSTGLSTSGQADFVLFSEVQFTATALGATQLSLVANSNGFASSAITNNDLSGSLDGVTASVNVSAVPEPSSAALLLTAAAGCAWRRRR